MHLKYCLINFFLFTRYKDMRMVNLNFYLILYTLMLITWQLTSSPSVRPNPIYGDAGSFSFVTTTYYNTVTTTLNPVMFTLTFTNRSSSTTDYLFGYTIQQINYQITNTRINYSLIIDGTKTATSIQAALYTNNANKISVLNIHYVIIEPLFGVYYFDYTWLTPGISLVNTQFYSFSKTTSSTLSTTGMTIWKTIVGVDATLATNRQIDVYLSVLIPSSTTINYKISTISPTSFFLTSIVVGCYIFNYNELNTNNRVGRFLWGSFGSVNNLGALTFADATQSVRTSNSILGTTSYHIANQNFLHIKCALSPNTTISATSLYSFNYMEFNYLILNFVYCTPATTPYLMVSTSTCYDACPIRYYSNTYNECTVCSNYRCYTCSSSGSCTQCSSAIDFRVLNSSTMSCDPMTGYYDNGVSSQAILCNAANCLTCTSNTFCLSCVSGKYLTASNTCTACTSTCLTCTSATVCQSCVTFYALSGGVCSISCTISNCITCAVVSSSLSCSTCTSGYYYTSGSSCNTLCGDSIKVGAQACDDGNTQSGDGCSSTCAIQNGYYCVMNGTKSVCQICSSNCLSCTAANNCLTCATFFVLSAGFCSINCTISNCISCAVVSSSLSCSSCTSGYYYTSGSACNTLCGDSIKVGTQACDDSNTQSGDGCSSSCALQNGFYCVMNGTKSVCQNCSSNCLSCTAANNCLTCATNFTFSNSLAICVAKCVINCTAECGNGALETGEKCDDGNLNSNDGCSSLCEVESYYSCQQNSSSTSICNIQNLTILQTSLNKDREANSVNFCMQFTPGKNPSYNSVNWSSVVTKPSSPNVNLTSFGYSLNEGSLCLGFQYFTNINGKVLTFGFNFPVSPPFALLSNITVSASLVSDNNLAVNAYSSDDYTLASILRAVVRGLSIIMLLFLTVGLFRYKIIPLEASAVYQVAGFSLLALEDLSPTLSALDELSFICSGYKFTFFTESVGVRRRFSPLGFGFNFANNYNFLGMVVLAIVGVGGVVYLVNGCMRVKKKGCEKVGSSLVWEYSFYVLMFSTYQIMISAAISLQGWGSATFNETVFFFTGCLFILLVLMYAIAELVEKGIFGGSDQFFKHESSFSNYFYCLVILQKIVTSLCFSFLLIQYQLSLALPLFLILLVVVASKRPYSRNSGNFRPGFNYTMILIILVIMLSLDVFKSSQGFSVYGPVGIVGCLLTTLIVNIAVFLHPFFSKNKQVLPMESSSFDSYSKRKLGNSNDKSVVEIQHYLPSPEKAEKEDDEGKSQEVTDVIDRLNSNFVVQNPYIHAFRTSNSKRKTAPKKDRERSAVMDDLLVLQQSLAQIRDSVNQRKVKRVQREGTTRREREDLESISQQ